MTKLKIVNSAPPPDVKIHITFSAKLIPREAQTEYAERYNVDTLYYYDTPVGRVVSIPSSDKDKETDNV